MPPKNKVAVKAEQKKTDGSSEFDEEVKEDAKFTYKWLHKDSLIYNEPIGKPTKLIACFDLDDTLISVKSGAKFAANSSDWKWWHDKVPEKLKELHRKG